jgi:hypothetical protein
MNSNWGLVDPINERIRDKGERRVRLAARAQADFVAWLEDVGLPEPTVLEPAMELPLEGGPLETVAS